MLPLRTLLLGVLCGVLAACPGTRAPNLPDHRARDGTSEAAPWSFLDLPPPGKEAGPSCSAATCGGCCAASGSCASGQSSSQCGKNGAPCANCAAKGYSCESYSCLGCTPACTGKTCGDSDGCGGACQQGSGCCSPSCANKICGDSNGCGGTCQSGSGCCSPSCTGKPCGDSNGCGGTCQQGSGCVPSCGGLLASKGLPDAGGGCCNFGCATTQGGGPGETHDCTYCCSSTAGQAACALPSCGALLNFKKLPDAGHGCCPSGCATTQGGGPGETYDCTYCCSSTGPGVCL